MKNYYVLTPPGATDPERQTLFIRDGFSWLAFLFPLPWLLVRKLWLFAAIAVAIYIIAIAVAEYGGLDGLPIAYTVILSLWTGLEGGHVRARWLERSGWDLKANVTAGDIDEAEAAYFDNLASAEAAKTARFYSPAASAHPGHPVALGLIGHYGNR